MEWNVCRHNVNRDKMEVYNIFEHGGFKEYVDKWLKECKEKEDFERHLDSELFYYFGSKAEWEIIISPWVGSRNNPEEKIDVYDQVMLNWDKFLNYVWSYKE